jgi:hypothetical protein
MGARNSQLRPPGCQHGSEHDARFVRKDRAARNGGVAVDWLPYCLRPLSLFSVDRTRLSVRRRMVDKGMPSLSAILISVVSEGAHAPCSKALTLAGVSLQRRARVSTDQVLRRRRS